MTPVFLVAAIIVAAFAYFSKRPPEENKQEDPEALPAPCSARAVFGKDIERLLRSLTQELLTLRSLKREVWGATREMQEPNIVDGPNRFSFSTWLYCSEGLPFENFLCSMHLEAGDDKLTYYLGSSVRLDAICGEYVGSGGEPADYIRILTTEKARERYLWLIQLATERVSDVISKVIDVRDRKADMEITPIASSSVVFYLHYDMRGVHGLRTALKRLGVPYVLWMSSDLYIYARFATEYRENVTPGATRDGWGWVGVTHPIFTERLYGYKRDAGLDVVVVGNTPSGREDYILKGRRIHLTEGDLPQQALKLALDYCSGVRPETIQQQEESTHAG